MLQRRGIMARLIIRSFWNSRNISNFFEDASVYATAVCYKDKSGESLARIATYWGRHDELNAYKPFTSGTVNIIRAQIESVSFALRQEIVIYLQFCIRFFSLLAIYDRKLDSVIVKTDSKFVEVAAKRFIPIWRNNDYRKVDGSPVKNREDLEELDRLLQSIQAQIQFYKSNTGDGNLVIKHLKEEGLVTDNFDELDEISYLKKQKQQSIVSATGKLIPVAYACGSQMKSGRGTFYVAGYGVHWGERNDGGVTIGDHCGRYAAVPVTLFRAQLTAIIVALEKAIENGLEEVVIATDCGMFLTHMRSKWVKSNGLPVANYPLYEKIMKLSDRIQVKFTYIPESLNKVEMQRAKQLSVDGMAYPLFSNKSKNSFSNFPADLMDESSSTEIEVEDPLRENRVDDVKL